MLLRSTVLALFLLVPCLVFGKTTTAIVSGNWTTAGTWNNGVPAAGDVVIIPAGITVSITGGTIDLRSAAATTITIGGALNMSNGSILWLDSTLDAVNVSIGGLVVPIGVLGGQIYFGNGFCCGFPASIFFINNFIPAPFGSNGSVPGPSIISNGTLPITLVSFSAQLQNDRVVIAWKTASEINNNFFAIERSSDAESFEEVLSIKGKGTTTEENAYEAIDKNPIIGRSYYRLKQTDFDGTATYSDLVMVEYEGPAFATLSAFPNPSYGKTLTLQLSGLKEVMDVPVRIVSMQGQLVYEGILQVDNTGKATSEIVFDEALASGLYVVKAGPTVFLTQKVAVIR